MEANSSTCKGSKGREGMRGACPSGCGVEHGLCCSRCDVGKSLAQREGKEMHTGKGLQRQGKEMAHCEVHEMPGSGSPFMSINTGSLSVSALCGCAQCAFIDLHLITHCMCACACAQGRRPR